MKGRNVLSRFAGIVGKYRSILVLTFLGVVGGTFLALGLTWYGAQKARYELVRTRLAHETLEAHLQLKVETYTLFKQLTDTFLAETPSRIDETAARERLTRQLDHVRSVIAREVATVGESEDETEELVRLAAIERQIGRVLVEFRAAEAVIARGGSLRDVPELDRVLESSIDGTFRELMDAALEEERREVRLANAAADVALGRIVFVSRLAGFAGAALALFALVVLVRRFQRPLDQLDAAARAVAAGDLATRVPSSGRQDEFARVGASFNTMVDEIARSRGQLETARRDLEGAIAQRTAELAAANDPLTRADAMRRRFLADHSPALRTPLPIIRGEAEVTLRGREPGAQDFRTALVRIVEQAVQTGRLVDDLLFVARADAGEPRLKLQAVSLEAVLRRAVSDAAVFAEPKNARIALQMTAADAVVQLVMILLDNAVRYSPRGGAVEVSLLPAPGGALLRVVDTGGGIAVDEAARVFERFYRGENAAARHPDGSGLGLPLAKAIAEAHGGTIALRSAVGEGTVVDVVLPVVRKLRVVA